MSAVDTPSIGAAYHRLRLAAVRGETTYPTIVHGLTGHRLVLISRTGLIHLSDEHGRAACGRTWGTYGYTDWPVGRSCKNCLRRAPKPSEAWRTP